MAKQIASVRPLSALAAPFEIHQLAPELWVLPRGGITEVFGEASTGRTAVAHWMLTNATRGGEISAVVDCDDAFDPASGRRAGVDLGKLLWVQCGHRLDVALKATDLILHSGGFGLIILDIGDMTPGALQRVPTSYWYRFQRAVEHTPSALLVIAQQPVARSCSVRQIGVQQMQLSWNGQFPFQTIERLRLQVEWKKPVCGTPVSVDACNDQATLSA